ncbi:unnamed protein product [Amoebophrya sp. A120]|nr:unnamed protein product [Amoebophrya sp. A120]|eukprot:GSA120T00019017001.1
MSIRLSGTASDAGEFQNLSSFMEDTASSHQSAGSESAASLAGHQRAGTSTLRPSNLLLTTNVHVKDEVKLLEDQMSKLNHDVSRHTSQQLNRSEFEFPNGRTEEFQRRALACISDDDEEDEITHALRPIHELHLQLEDEEDEDSVTAVNKNVKKPKPAGESGGNKGERRGVVEQAFFVTQHQKDGYNLLDNASDADELCDELDFDLRSKRLLDFQSQEGHVDDDDDEDFPLRDITSAGTTGNRAGLLHFDLEKNGGNENAPMSGGLLSGDGSSHNGNNNVWHVNVDSPGYDLKNSVAVPLRRISEEMKSRVKEWKCPVWLSEICHHLRKHWRELACLVVAQVAFFLLVHLAFRAWNGGSIAGDSGSPGVDGDRQGGSGGLNKRTLARKWTPVVGLYEMEALRRKLLLDEQAGQTPGDLETASRATLLEFYAAFRNFVDGNKDVRDTLTSVGHEEDHGASFFLDSLASGNRVTSGHKHANARFTCYLDYQWSKPLFELQTCLRCASSEESLLLEATLTRDPKLGIAMEWATTASTTSTADATAVANAGNHGAPATKMADMATAPHVWTDKQRKSLPFCLSPATVPV